jgi:hypothetical protein
VYAPPPVEKVASISDAARKLAVLARLRVGATVVALPLVFFAALWTFGAPHPARALSYLAGVAAVVAAVVCLAVAWNRAAAAKLRAVFGADRVVISDHTPAPEQPRRAAAAAVLAFARAAVESRRLAGVISAQLGCALAVLAARLLPAPAVARA